MVAPLIPCRNTAASREDVRGCLLRDSSRTCAEMHAEQSRAARLSKCLVENL